MSELGSFLKKLRGRMSLREAAEKSGVSYTYISSLESGKHPRTGAPIKPSPEILKKLSKAYSYPYDDLMEKVGYLDEKNEYVYMPNKVQTDYVIKEMVAKYNIDLSDPGKAEKLEKLIQLVFDEQNGNL